jgi:hypothetical protein
VRPHRPPDGVGQRSGRGRRAGQVAAVDGGERLVGERARHLPGLPAARVVEGDVGMALDARADVPVGLAVADRDDPRGGVESAHAGTGRADTVLSRAGAG